MAKRPECIVLIWSCPSPCIEKQFGKYTLKATEAPEPVAVCEPLTICFLLCPLGRGGLLKLAERRGLPSKTSAPTPTSTSGGEAEPPADSSMAVDFSLTIGSEDLDVTSCEDTAVELSSPATNDAVNGSGGSSIGGVGYQEITSDGGGSSDVDCEVSHRRILLVASPL